jgi:thiamine-monophosphate kinase
MTETNLENSLIELLVRRLPRSPLQLNALHEADAELVRLPGLAGVLALTVDNIVEEIELGLYADPYLIGWMTVTVSASDLAAVGADPVGVLLMETLPPDMDAGAIELLQAGIADACATYDLPVLGGDTNTSACWQMGSAAIGLVPEGCVLTRIGACPGDALFASGQLGLGSAFALARLLRLRHVPDYRPNARLREGRLLRRIASSCMDTSDGLLATLDQLVRIADVGFLLDPPEEWLHPEAVALASSMQVPPWMMAAGLHGEFELVFTVPGKQLPMLRRIAAGYGWKPVRIGTVVNDPGVEIRFAEGTAAVDTGRIRDLFAEPSAEHDHWVEQLGECITSNATSHG